MLMLKLASGIISLIFIGIAITKHHKGDKEGAIFYAVLAVFAGQS